MAFLRSQEYFIGREISAPSISLTNGYYELFFSSFGFSVFEGGGKEEPLLPVLSFEPFEEGVEALINASRVLAKVSIEEVRLV